MTRAAPALFALTALLCIASSARAARLSPSSTGRDLLQASLDCSRIPNW